MGSCSSRVWSKGTVSRFPLPADKSTQLAEPNYLAWKKNLESTAAKFILCSQEHSFLARVVGLDPVLSASLFGMFSPSRVSRSIRESSPSPVRTKSSVHCILSMVLGPSVATIEIPSFCKGQLAV